MARRREPQRPTGPVDGLPAHLARFDPDDWPGHLSTVARVRLFHIARDEFATEMGVPFWRLPGAVPVRVRLAMIGADDGSA